MKALAVTADALPLSDVTTYTGEQPLLLYICFIDKVVFLLYCRSFIYVVDDSSDLIGYEHPPRRSNEDKENRLAPGYFISNLRDSNNTIHVLLHTSPQNARFLDVSDVCLSGEDDTVTWDEEMIYGCVCDSAWEVGLGSGQTQEPEWFGPDCSLRHCPSGDDPSTDEDETDCEGVTSSSVYSGKVASTLDRQTQ